MPFYDALPVRQRGSIQPAVVPIATEEWAGRLGPRNSGVLDVSLALGINGSRRDGTQDWQQDLEPHTACKSASRPAFGRGSGSDQSYWWHPQQ